MMISEPQPESSHRPFKGVSGLFLLFLMLGVVPGCQSGPPPAPASNYVFTKSQATQTRDVLETLAQEAPRDPVVPLDLLPADGVRWETLRDAVSHAVSVPELEMAITQTVTISENEQRFYLVDSRSWPARITVTRFGDKPGVVVEAIMGPDPFRKRNQAVARDVEKRVLKSIRQYGRIKRLAPYEIKMTPRTLVSPMTKMPDIPE